MRIAHVITTIDLGGAENHLFQLVKSQVQIGHQVKVFYLKGDHYWKSQLNDLGIGTVCLGITHYAFLLKFLKLKRELNSFEPDLVHAHMPPAELVCRLALIGNERTPLVISKHNDEPFAPFFKNRLLANWVARRAKAVICISEAVKTYMQKWLSLEMHGKLKRIYYAVDKSVFETARPASDLRFSGDFVIGTVARLTKQKSIPTLLSAFARFREHRSNSKLVIVGLGELESFLKQQAQDLGISESVIWAGKRKDIPGVLKAFDVFVLPSIYEGLGLVLLEAMAAEVPIIASKVSAIPEVLDQGNCGLLFPPGDVESLKTCLVQMQDESLRRSYILNGQERVRDFFSPERMRDETEAVYRLSTAD